MTTETHNPVEVTQADAVKHMTERFLQWKLPADFNPDAGISFTPDVNVGTAHQYRHEPIGTNLLSYTQAEAMVLHMLEGAALTPTVSEADELVERTDSGLVADMLTSAAHQPHTRAFTNAQIVEAFAALEAAALRAQPSNEADRWRTWGTAPGDGTVVLAYRPDAGVFTAHYVEEDAHISTALRPPEGDTYWFTTGGEDLTGDMPTHWRPLPAAPDAPSVQAGGEVERLIEALKFYARASTYLRQPTGGLAVAATPIDCDRGDRARAALNPEGSGEVERP